MKIFFLIIFLFVPLYGGYEFIYDTRQELDVVKCHLYQIRTQLGLIYGENSTEMEKKIQLTPLEKNEWYSRFDILFKDFQRMKPKLKKWSESDQQKEAFDYLEREINKDKKRYARVRRLLIRLRTTDRI